MNRITPNLDPMQYDSYIVRAPVETHFRDASCQEVDCLNLANGWHTYVDERTTLGQMQSHYIRNVSGRFFTETLGEDRQTDFWFPAGQRCFVQHRVRLDRPELFGLKAGDWRVGGRPREVTGGEWLDRFAENQFKLRDMQQRGY